MNFYKTFSKLFLKGFEKEGEMICRDCQPFVKMGAKILDLGCGNGIFSKKLKDFFQADLIGVDLQDRRVVNIPFKLVSGENLPFADNTFDVVFINFLLHHTSDYKKVLTEAKRASRGKIIIYEDLKENFIDDVSFILHKFTYKLFFRPYNLIVSFKSEREWEEIFKNLGLKILSKKKAPSIMPFDLRNRKQLILNK
ncbi:MAG: class I SAM-dependent methyltransferase [bacterium]|nr:class I SAM-dependent methyltransferase [bacterium]